MALKVVKCLYIDVYPKEVLKIGSRNIRFWTDAPNRLNTGSYGVSMGVIANSDISTRPIIEFICTEEGVLTFVNDIIK